MAQPHAGGLGVALLEGPQLGEEQALGIVVIAKRFKCFNLLVAHDVTHQAGSQVGHELLHIYSHGPVAKSTRNEAAAVREVEVQLGMVSKNWLAVLALSVLHVVLAQAVLAQHAVEQQAGAGAQVLAAVEAVAQGLGAAVVREQVHRIVKSPWSCQGLYVSDFHRASTSGEVPYYFNKSCQSGRECVHINYLGFEAT